MMPAKISLIHGDLTVIEADAIVNAANLSLAQGGGVDLAIRTAAGTQINTETSNIIRKYPAALSDGKVVTTGSYNMTTCKYVFHVAAPDIKLRPLKIPIANDERTLRSCYYNSMRAGDARKTKSLAFPILGIGIFGYPKNKGFLTALQSILAYFEDHEHSAIEDVYLVVNHGPTLNQFTTLMGGTPRIDLNLGSAEEFRMKLENDFLSQVHPSRNHKIGNVDVASFIEENRLRVELWSKNIKFVNNRLRLLLFLHIFWSIPYLTGPLGYLNGIS